MKKIIGWILILSLLSVCAFGVAEEDPAYYYADEQLGLRFYIDSSWQNLALENAVAFSPEYAQDGGAMVFYYVKDDAEVKLFAIAVAPVGAEYKPEGAGEALWSEEKSGQTVSLYRFAELSGAEYDAVLSLLDDASAYVAYTPASERFLYKAETVSGEEYDCAAFYGHALTMINVWATYCSPCIAEMPDLKLLADEMQSKDCMLVGVVSDVYYAGGEEAETAIGIIENAGANNYTHLCLSEDLYATLCADLQYVPTTYFLNAEGVVLGSEVGSHSLDEWREIVNTYLAK